MKEIKTDFCSFCKNFYPDFLVRKSESLCMSMCLSCSNLLTIRKLEQFFPEKKHQQIAIKEFVQ